MIDFARTNWWMAAIFVLCFILLKKAKMNPILVMVLAGVMKLAVSLIP